ncbi:MAG: putative protease YhbU precursor [Deltaproteobacteria bacterium ADurb.Bin510]|nr:MAG: putative protease YhbU precursor [Deltaproteobacteria bacterium ADurb.Bin510]
MRKPEILAPAGSREMLESAVIYGADAVYLGLDGGLNLRAAARNFSPDELCEAVSYAHAHAVRVYLTLNAFPHDHEFAQLAATLEAARAAKVDALIVADAGVLATARELAPEIAIHLSTQANTVNSAAVRFWQAQGVSRVILARELSAVEIAAIRQATGAEIEIFVHGSVCISISGRCQISHYLNERDPNRGACSQPCRWAYALTEETRPGQYFPVIEDDGHTYLYNSRDLNLLPLIDQIMGLDVQALKIEGRNRTSLYVATITRAYRRAVDAFAAAPANFRLDPELLADVTRVSHREYFTGFFEAAPVKDAMRYSAGRHEQSHHLAAKVVGINGNRAVLEARNPLLEGMDLTWLNPDGADESFTLKNALADGQPVSRLKPNQIFELELPFRPAVGQLLRKPYSEGDRVL